ncbi:MAG TPA: biopolymer transporter ExbD [Vicinamibacteria bacterium]|nr:biopolymer transporter ExbD [Vicinamibacteria bacterium]
MAMSVAGPKGAVITDINVTPMADVMIVLLINFMVATPVLVRAPVQLPTAVHPTEQKERLEVVVRATGEITAGGLTFGGPDSLAEWIAARRAGGMPQRVLLQADRGVAYGVVASVLAGCREARVEEVALAAERRAER